MEIKAKIEYAKGDGHPIVRAAIKGKNGVPYFGNLLIDTGAECCLLNKSVLPLLEPSTIHEDMKKTLYSFQSDGDEHYGVDLTFKMGHGEFTELFYVNERMEFDYMIDEFIGLVGAAFLYKHGLVVDFSNDTLHSSCLDGEIEISRCDFFFPMTFGFACYRVPVVGFLGNEKEFIMIADSGADDTVLTKHAIEVGGLQHKGIGKRDHIVGINNHLTDVAVYDVELSLASISEQEGEFKICYYHDAVLVDENRMHLEDGFTDPDGNAAEPISGLLSSSFMHKHKWVLDFGFGAIYSEKNNKL